MTVAIDGKPMARRRTRTALAFASATALLFASCTGGQDTSTVQGKVSYNGNLVTSGLINFLPQGGRPLGGGINSDGTYSFDLPPGEYQVRVDAPAPLPAGYKEGDPLPDPTMRPVPEQYANYNTSGLTVTVKPGGPQTADFTLP